MKADPKSPKNQIRFQFAGGTNFDPAKDMHMHEGTLSIADDDHIEFSGCRQGQREAGRGPFRHDEAGPQEVRTADSAGSPAIAEPQGDCRRGVPTHTAGIFLSNSRYTSANGGHRALPLRSQGHRAAAIQEANTACIPIIHAVPSYARFSHLS